VELRTDQLHDGPVTYRFGDKPALAVRANRECFVRLIYVAADGQRLLLLDGYHIGLAQANGWVKLPLELEACAPAGVEQMLLQAATTEAHEKLPPFKVRRVDAGGGGYLPVIEETLDDALTRTRGIMKRDPALFAEVPYQWTVFAE